MRPAIYTRFSDKDRDNESSIEDQLRVCREFAARQGWEITEDLIFEEPRVSGVAFGNRPAFLRMREAAMSRRFDVLLVNDTTRLARSQDLAPLVERFRFQGVRVIGVQDNFDSTSSTADMQAGMSGIMSVEFIKMIRRRTHAALESRAKEHKPTGGRAYGYRDGLVDKGEAFMVREIFGKFVDGKSCRAIAADLNERRIPSPGSTWKRTERRAAGWMGSAIRAMLRNQRYIGRVIWNKSVWIKDPDSGKRQRRDRPQSEWIIHQDESQRIVSDDLWSRAQRRIERTAENNHWGASRGKTKYLLSGLLRCETCGSHYVIVNALEYGCSGYVNGRACSNGVRIRRNVIEEKLIGPLRTDFLSQERIGRVQAEMQRYYSERLRATQTRTQEAPRELAELVARIDRLRERLHRGDPDMAPDELQAAIDRAEAKRQNLLEAQPAAKESAKLLTILPRAAEMYRRQITQGLDGNAREAMKARVFLREYFGGRIDLEPGESGELWANYSECPTALLLQAVGNRGSGGRI